MLNESSIEKLFRLEHNILWAAEGIEPWPWDTAQSWYSGSWEPPRDDKTFLENLDKAKSLGLIDTTGAIMEYYGVDEETALEMQKKMQERNTDATPA